MYAHKQRLEDRTGFVPTTAVVLPNAHRLASERTQRSYLTFLLLVWADETVAIATIDFFQYKIWARSHPTTPTSTPSAPDHNAASCALIAY